MRLAGPALLVMLLFAADVHAADGGFASAMREGRIHLDAARFGKAVVAFEAAAASARALPAGERALKELEAQRYRLGCLHRLGRFVELRNVMRRVLELHRIRRSSDDVLLTQIDLATIELELGNARAALDMLAEVRTALGEEGALRDAAKRHVARIDTELRSAQAARMSRAYADALQHADRALELQKDAPKPSVRVGEALLAKGTIHLELGARDECRRLYGLAEEHFVGRPDKRAVIAGNLGIAAYEDGEFESAQQHLAQAAALFEQSGWHARAARVPIQQAVMYLHAREFAKALERLGPPPRPPKADGRPRPKAADRSPSLAEAYRQLYRGRAYLGLAELEHAADAFTRTAAAADILGDRHLLAEVKAAQAEVALTKGEAKPAVALAVEALEALDGIVAALSPASGAEARHARGHIYETAARVGCATGDPNQAYDLLERGRAAALVQMLGGADVFAHIEVPDALRDEETQLREALREARVKESLAGPTNKRAPIRKAMADRRAAELAYEGFRRRLQREARRRMPLLGVTPPSLKAVAAGLAAHERLVLYSLTDAAAHALVIGPKRSRVRDLGDVATLRKVIEELDIEDPKREAIRTAAAEVRKRLLDPLKLPKSVRRLLISPDGIIGSIPFTLLDESREFAFTPSATVHHLLADRRKRTRGPMLAIGDPAYAHEAGGRSLDVYFGRRRVQRLSGTRAELEAIKRKGDRLVLGPDASKDGFLAAVRSRKSWDTLVFACHGYANAHRPSQSGLALTPGKEHDGYLCAGEIFGMRIPANLVVLSACDSGRGTGMRGDGMTGLAGAFLYAGSPRVIASLWKVPDDATAALMSRFHELWRPKNGARPLAAGEALRQAQTYVRKQSRWSHPSDWAAWVLWGRPD